MKPYTEEQINKHKEKMQELSGLNPLLFGVFVHWSRIKHNLDPISIHVNFDTLLEEFKEEVKNAFC